MSRLRTAPIKSVKRREGLRRAIPKPALNLLAVLQKPEFIRGTLVLAAFLAITSTVVNWSRDQVKVRDGQIMSETRLYRHDFTTKDEEETASNREEARKSSPRVYRLNQASLDRLEAALAGLPKAVAGKTSLTDITLELVREFGLDERGLIELQNVVVDGAASREWTRLVNRFVQEVLLRNPLLVGQEFQVFNTTRNKALLLPTGELTDPMLPCNPVELPAEAASAPDSHIVNVVTKSNLPQALIPYISAKIQTDAQPTFTYSEEETKRLEQSAVDRVPVVMVRHTRGDVLYKRGDELSPTQYSDVKEEAKLCATLSSRMERWQPRLGVVALIALATLFIGSFATIAYPRLARNTLRLGAVCLLMSGMLAVTVLLTRFAPMFLLPAAIGPTLFVAIILRLAYDQRFGLLLSGIQSAFVTVALEQDAGFFLMLLCGCAAAIVQLRELRHRNSLIRSATGTAAVLGIATIALGLVQLPAVDGAWNQILVMALSAVLTSYGVSFLVLGILPSIERMFDITTGMTLAELRDPKRPLLRQLQQKAPGSYNHSLQVANIAEAAADAIEADGLLVYVGAMYHDIGKIHKPEYFVENQAGGYNKHEKLSPAMSLLVIIGHVKDGVELAREYGLPRSLMHFIESHHGTTLVEYFYRAACDRAEHDDQDEVEETEFRYPGPKPRTKEAAILMLSDAVESAARTMTEPNPGRIENLVRRLSRNRLDDGQFDQCDLTFRELRLIEDAIISRLCAIHHSRISYPSSTTIGNGQRASDQADGPKSASIPRPVSV